MGKAERKAGAAGIAEAAHQENIMQWAQYNLGKYPELAMLFHIPNGGSRNKLEAYNLKRQGVKAGVPDLCLPVPRGKYNGLYIELKKENGRASTDQRWWGEQLQSQGYYWQICYGWEAAVKTIEEYLRM